MADVSFYMALPPSSPSTMSIYLPSLILGSTGIMTHRRLSPANFSSFETSHCSTLSHTQCSVHQSFDSTIPLVTMVTFDLCGRYCLKRRMTPYVTSSTRHCCPRPRLTPFPLLVPASAWQLPSLLHVSFSTLSACFETTPVTNQ